MTRATLGLRAQFVIAGTLLVVATAVSSAWSAYSFREVSRVVDATLRDSQETTAATAALASALEREDDALLLTLTDEARGLPALRSDRQAVAVAQERLRVLLTGPGEPDKAASIGREIETYHRAGDALLGRAREPEARLRYHEVVNPLLRRAVAAASRIRDDHFRYAQEAATWARDRATRSTQILTGVTLGALFISILVALYLARAVVLPIRSLTSAVEAMRRGEFERRVPSGRRDEIGALADGFNRMAEDLAAFRRANIGEVVRAKETLEATLAALPDAVVVVEPDGTIATTNARAVAVLGGTATVVARRLESLPIDQRARAEVMAALHGTSEGGSHTVDLTRATTVEVDGAKHRLLPRAVAIEGLPEGKRGAVLVLSDVTELARLDEMRMELIAVASHELRTPMTTLRMTLLMLQERAAALGERDRELVRTALLGVDQLAGTVDEFLDLTRIEAGELRLQWDRVDLVALVRREAKAAQAMCDDAGITLVVDVAEQAEMGTRGDVVRLHVVLSNLLANALKYTPSGGQIALRAEDGDAFTVVVEDTGPGIPAEFRERIFEKFFRVEHHRSGDAGVRGSGIGLYIAREIVEAHGGTLRCEGRPGGGTRMVVSLPRSAS